MFNKNNWFFFILGFLLSIYFLDLVVFVMYRYNTFNEYF